MLNAAIPATLIALKCPRCGVIQVRARRPTGERYECRRCREPFTAEQGKEKELAAARLRGERIV